MPFNPAAPMAKWKVRLEISIFMIYGRCATRMLLVERLSYEHSSTPNGCAESRCEDQPHYLVFAEDWTGAYQVENSIGGRRNSMVGSCSTARRSDCSQAV